jgi:hypothetical protein
MGRINFVQHKGKSILIEDFTNLKPPNDMDEFLRTVKEAHQAFASQPQKSVLAVFDVTNSSFNTEILSVLKDFTVSNTPYVKCAVIVGLTGLMKVALTTVSKLTGRSFQLFPSRQAALDFLVTQ